MATNVVLPTAPPARRSSPPPTRAVASSRSSGRVVRALLAKNWIVKKRHPFATLSELLIPLLCIVLFASLKRLDPDLDIPAGWATSDANATAGPSIGSRWGLYAETSLLSDLNASLAEFGMSSVAGGKGNSSTSALGNVLNGVFPQLDSNMSLDELLNSTLAQLNVTQPSPLSLLTYIPQLWLPRFYFTETTMPGLMLSMGLQSLAEADRLDELVLRDLVLCIGKFLLLGFTSTDPLSLYYLPTECRGKVVPYKLAIAPDTLYTRKYVTRVFDEWYPRLPLIEPVLGVSPLTAPSFADSRVLFANETALETYLQSQDYGLDIDHPKIYAAIAFQDFPQTAAEIGDVRGHDIAFSVRMNSTYTDTNFPNSVPRTISRRYRANNFVRSVKSQNTMIYSTRGFLTLQTAVMRVLNCLPPWDLDNERVQDVDVCQITQSIMDDTSDELDNRLLAQLDGDVIIGKLARLGRAASEVLANPSLRNGTANTTAVIAQALKTLSKPATTAANIPESTRRLLLRVLRQAPQPFHGASIFMSPTEAFHYAGFYQKVLVVFPVLFILSYLYGVSRVIVALLMEKETRSRELMKILGIHDYQIILTWLATYVQLFFLGSLLQSVGASVMLFANSSGVLLFVFFFTFALSSFGFGFLISTLFNRARAGSFVGMGVFFMMFFVSFSFKESSTEAARTLSCLLSPVALSQGISIIAQLESIEVGIQFANAYDNIGGFRFMSAVYMQLLDFVLYMALGWYLDKVMPKEYGVSERWYFPVSPVYWRRACRRRQRNRSLQPATEDTALAILDGNDPQANRMEELVSSELKQQELDDRAIVISRLRKVFDVPGGTKVAVHGLDLVLYEGQITCLLGHNGAGKTTLMSMLTGMTPPTSGDARIRGVSLLDGMDTIRESLGYCPQFSVVYPELTVEEHLRFYARVKQDHTLPRGGADSVERMIREVGLTEKRGVRAHALSGGMKRKLSLAISFLGDNQVVFLDEPTSGMDPYSRRSTWELIQRHKAGRIVILTTHFMDEADLLGDRIAIMAEGELRCVGSSLFLKQRYGVGYRLSFVVKANATSTVDEKQFITLVQSHVAEARLATDIGTELTFQLPFEASSRFPALFDAIDVRKGELGITSYAISVTTLEEIFLKVAETRATPDTASNAESRHKPTVSLNKNARDVDKKLDSVVADDDQSSTRVSHGRAVWFLIQLRALLLKRLLSATRDRAMLFYSTLLPIVILFAGLSALRLSLFIKNDPRIDLTPVDQFALGAKTPLPVTCVEAGGGGNDSTSGWCDAALTFFPDATPSQIAVESIVYDGAVSPTVFNLPYVAPKIAPNDTTGYCVRFAQLAFQRGYGKNSESAAPMPAQVPVVGQFGGLLFQGTARDRVLAYNVMVNSSATHGAPTYKALADQAIHNFLLANHNASATVPFRSVSVATHPFPLSFKTRSIFGSFLSLPAVLFVLIAFTFIPAAMMPFLVKEKQQESNARHQQLLSGVSLPAYWLANLFFDLLLYVVPMVVTILLLRFYNISSSLSGGNADAKTCTACTRDVPQAVGALFVFFGTAIAPWTYLMSHVMHDAGACLLYTVMLNFVFGIVLLLTSYSLDSLDSTRAANESLVFLWRLSPLFSLANGLLRVILADIQALFGFNSVPLSAFANDIAGYEIAYLAAEGPVFFALALLIDLVKTGELTLCGRDFRSVYGVWRDCITTRWQGHGKPVADELHMDAHTNDAAFLTEDEDVRAERQRILDGHASSKDEGEIVRLKQLSKTYANGKRALSSLTFGLQRGDCFGFLGINGAGKTTTMKILTGDLFPTQGSATLNGFDILRERASVRQSIGYCPQFDALLELLTVREHLELFGRLKGFSGARLARVVARLLKQFELDVFERKLAGSLSGGNKRKLSVAIAMLGEPALLFLDEPSTGMDPFSRRFMWDIILHVSVQSRKSTVVLTTHSMEECEALCNRAGIMVGGRLQCFGTIPHLKARFGDGFLLECKLEGAARAPLDALVDQLAQRQLVRDDRRVARAQLGEACAVLGAPERVDWILPTRESHGLVPPTHPTGVALFEQLQRSSELVGDAGAGLDVQEFGAWWLLEDRVVALEAFLRRHFGAHGRVAMIERQVDFCRFKLTPAASTTTTTTTTTSESEETTRPFALARMFRLLEDARRELGVKEYAIAQTSLEQIFNGFARLQDEEKDVARGFVGG